MTKHHTLLSLALLALLPLQATGQDAWHIDRCIAYAMEHALSVQRGAVELQNAQTGVERAHAPFIPYLSAGVGAQVSWGRNVDPETNTYNTVTTLNNSYQLNTGLTLWDGMQSINALRQALLYLKQGHNALQETRDRLAMDVMQKFTDALYAHRMTELAREKEADSRRLLEQTRRMAELGQKCMPDVAQLEAQLAADVYEAVRQHNETRRAMSQLCLAMNYTQADSLLLIILPVDTAAQPLDINAPLYPIPAVVGAQYAVKLRRLDLKMARGRLSPSLSVGAGISTGYFRNLAAGATPPSFGRQWRDNMGQYVSASLQLPLFNYGTYKDIRRARHMERIAQIDCVDAELQAREAHRQALRDVEGGQREVALMHTRVHADSVVHRLNVRRYEEGLLSTIDLQHSAQTLHQSRIRLLQAALTLALRRRVAQYYQTGSITKS